MHRTLLAQTRFRNHYSKCKHLIMQYAIVFIVIQICISLSTNLNKFNLICSLLIIKLVCILRIYLLFKQYNSIYLAGVFDILQLTDRMKLFKIVSKFLQDEFRLRVLISCSHFISCVYD